MIKRKLKVDLLIQPSTWMNNLICRNQKVRSLAVQGVNDLKKQGYNVIHNLDKVRVTEKLKSMEKR